MSAQAGSASIASRPAVVGQSHPGSAERLVQSMIRTADATPKVGFALQMGLFADAVIDALPPVPSGKIAVQEALKLESHHEVQPSEEVFVSGESVGLLDSHLITLAATRPSSPAKPLAVLTTRIRIAEPATVSAQTGRGRRRPGVPTLVVSISAEHLAAYAALSGDPNPIHTDLALARSLGLRERVVHGALLAFLIAPALASAGIEGTIRKVQMRFLGPAFAGEILAIFADAAASGGPGTTRARILAIRPDGLICCAADVQVED